jgi:hypothetical protein
MVAYGNNSAVRAGQAVPVRPPECHHEASTKLHTKAFPLEGQEKSKKARRWVHENIWSGSKCTWNSGSTLRRLRISDVPEGFSALHQDQYDVTSMKRQVRNHDLPGDR